MQRRLVLATGVVVVSAVAVSNTAARIGGSEPKVRFIRAPAHAAFDDVVWLPSLRRLVVTYRRGWTSRSPHYIASLRLDGSGLRRLPLARDSACPQQVTYWPIPLANGSLAYLHQCYGNASRLPNRVTRLMVYDPRTGRNSKLRPYYLPLWGARFSISRDGMVIASEGDPLSAQLFWLEPRRQVRVRVALTATGTPSWSPNGSRIVVNGRPAGSPWSANLRNLYLLDRSGRLLRTLMRGLEFASQAAWSPDGRTLAVSLQPHGESAGIWLVDAVSGRHRLLLRGTDFGAPIWLPDGHTLVTPVGSLPAPGSGPSGKARIGLYEISVPR
jgi:WD40-like Beta Propeller Repeat